MSKSTDVNGVKTVWSKEDRWSGSSSELANFIKWLKDHAEGDIMSYFYLLRSTYNRRKGSIQFNSQHQRYRPDLQN